MVEPGRTCLGDRYELGTLIAAGGMGQVWRGHDVLLGRPVAVKVLRSEYTGDPTFLARFRAEAQNAAALNHSRIAAVYDYGETIAQDGSGETLAYLVMELVGGEPLSTVLRRGALDTETTLRVLGQTAAGLAEAHRAGMVHRDVKPANILVCPDGDVKITDFGIAWSARSVALTGTGQIIGTPQYLSPEQAEGRQATPASDVYGLGLIGYECLTGRPAFDGDNPVTIALKQVRDEPEPLPDDLPVHVRTLIRRALAKDPAARLADGAAFAAAVEAVRDGRPIDDGPRTRAVAAVAVAGAAVAGSRSGRGQGADVLPQQRGSRRGSRPAGRRRVRLAVVLLPLLGLLAGAGVAAMVLQGLAGNGTPPAAEAAEQRDGAAIVLVEADYVGRPADEVALQLAALGLTVRREVKEDPAAQPGTVVGVEPAGEALNAGDTVILQVATAPGPGSGGSGGAASTGAAGATGAAGTAAAAESPDPAPGAATGTEAPDDGGTPPDVPIEVPAEAPTDGAPVEEAPAEEAPVEEAPVEEAPVEEAPAEEAPVEEAPADEEPTTEAPVDEGGTAPAPATTATPSATATQG